MTAHQTLYEEMEARIERGAEVLPLHLTEVEAAIAQQESLIEHFVEGQLRNQAQGEEHNLGEYAADFIDQTIDELRTELGKGQKVANQLGKALDGRGMSVRVRPAALPIATHVPAAE